MEGGRERNGRGEEWEGRCSFLSQLHLSLLVVVPASQGSTLDLDS